MAIPYFPNENIWNWWIAPIMTVIALLAAFYIVHYEAKRKKLDIDMFYRASFWMLIGALVGGRLAYFLTPGSGFLDIMKVGFHSYGVILGGFGGLVLYCQHARKNIEEMHKSMNRYLSTLADIWVLGAAIGIFFYRIGCFLSYCIERGTQTDLPWGVMSYGVPRHPITLYYSIAALFIFVIIMEFRNSSFAGRFPGVTAALFIGLDSTSRFVLDFLRDYERLYELSFSQIVFFALMVIVLLHILSIIILYKAEKKKDFIYPPLDLVLFVIKKFKKKCRNVKETFNR